MIDKNEVENLLSGHISERLICHEFELRPSVISPDIKILANIVDEYGFIVLGVSLLGERYTVNGIAGGLMVDDVVNKAIEQLTVKPEIEICSMILYNKT